jgi:hypothetical protein
MSTRIKLAIAAFVLIFIGVIVYSSYQATGNRYRVCVTLNGRTHCAVAQGRTPQEAITSAQQIDCGLLSNSRDELMVCSSKQPESVEPVK